jgi:hypothetical protein
MKPFEYRLHHDVIGCDGIDQCPVQVKNKTRQSKTAIPCFLGIVFDKQHEIPLDSDLASQSATSGKAGGL